MPRFIMHLDMDAFFASVEERENPVLKGRPIVVGADPKGGKGRGVVSTASYAARKFGIHSAMPISQAWKLCPVPQCVYLPVDMRLYEIVSGRIMEIIFSVVIPRPMAEESHTLPTTRGEISRFARNDEMGPKIEQVSVDEAYIDASFGGSYEEAEKLAHALKSAITKQERLTCSIGIGPNKLIAKIASDFKKPDGLTVVRPEEVEAFLSPLPIRKLPGIGPKTEALFMRRGIQTVADLRLALSADDELYKKACGLDDSPVVEEYEAKSLGREMTFEQDTRDQAVLTRMVMELCDEVVREARQKELRFKTVTVRVRFDNFETHTSRKTLPEAGADDIILRKTVLRLVFPYFKDKRQIRLIGVRVSNFQ